jgi:hypothetical protein
MDLDERHASGRRPRPSAPAPILAAAILAILVAACGNSATPSPSPGGSPGASAPSAASASPVGSSAGSPPPSTGEIPTPEPKQVAQVPVVACPTTYASPGQTMPPVGTTQTATITESVAATVTFYSNGELTVLGPKGWQCSATIATDGSARMAITPPDRPWPAGSATPPPDTQAVTAISSGSCTDCVATLACVLFPEAGQLTDAACAATLPAQEAISRPLPRSAAFVDPPGVAGTGDPSGGQYRAVGFLVFDPGGKAAGGSSLPPSAMKVTCTLDASMAPICDEIVEHD